MTKASKLCIIYYIRYFDTNLICAILCILYRLKIHIYPTGLSRMNKWKVLWRERMILLSDMKKCLFSCSPMCRSHKYVILCNYLALWKFQFSWECIVQLGILLLVTPLSMPLIIMTLCVSSDRLELYTVGQLKPVRFLRVRNSWVWSYSICQ